MDCNIVKDLIPLYIDGCCSKESKQLVEEHIQNCSQCKKLLADMNTPTDMVTVSKPPKVFRKLNDWKASVLQSALLFLSFALITIGVALEAQTPAGLTNGFWAMNLVIPATGFMLSLANWYFISVYKNRKSFSACSLLSTSVITFGAYVWSVLHYKIDIWGLFAGADLAEMFEILQALSLHYGMGILLTVVFCALSKLLSNQYGKMLGKE